jgi:hypothetical protein
LIEQSNAAAVLKSRNEVKKQFAVEMYLAYQNLQIAHCGALAHMPT